MPSPPESEVTRLLHAAHEGDGAAFDALIGLVYDQLRGLARRVRSGKGSATLNTTALVHEAYLRLLPSRALDWNGRVHFFRVAARAMRQVMVRAAEERAALKRGGGAPVVEFDERVHAPLVQADQVVALDRALQELEKMDERQAHVVECRFFAGMTVGETAEALGIGTATVKRDWRAARAWLGQHLA